MKNNNEKKPELLAPAGDPESLEAATSQGCDAVYLGGKLFSARASAQNFTEDEIFSAIDFCHLRGIKVYAALNTIYKNRELPDVLETVWKLACRGADAFILQDIGAASAIKKCWPQLKLHASTQMTAQTLDDVLFLAESGFSRVVLSRELALSEVKAASRIIETEVFIHGSLCASYSGRCLISAALGCRSGNRGKCAQTCRMRFRLEEDGAEVSDGYLLSAKDMMTLDILPEIIDSGASSLKIEGRMRGAAYTACAVYAYRQALDGLAENPEALKNDLLQVFNRGGGFCQGYFKTHAGKEMISVKTSRNTGVKAGYVKSWNEKKKSCLVQALVDFSAGDGLAVMTQEEPVPGCRVNRPARAGEAFFAPVSGKIRNGDPVYKTFDKALNDKLLKLSKASPKKMALRGEFSADAGKRARLALYFEGICAEAFSEVLETAQSSPSSEDEIKKRLSKTGASPFDIAWSEFRVGEGLFFPVSSANSLRREAMEIASGLILESRRRDLKAFDISCAPKKSCGGKSLKLLSVYVQNSVQLKAAAQEGVDRISLPLGACGDLSGALSLCEKYGVSLFIALPDIGPCSENDIKRLEKTGIEGYTVRQWGQFKLLEESKKKKHADFTFPIYNRISLEFIEDFADTATLSPEMKIDEIEETADERSELIAYARLPLMTTRQCPVGNFIGQRSEGGKYCSLKDNFDHGYVIIDRKNISFPLERDCERCVCHVLNSTPQDWLSKARDASRLPAGRLGLHFHGEDCALIESAVGKWVAALRGGFSCAQEGAFTYGLLFRGVD
ncbi:MAG: U32 family peptidase [Clostridiales bacterium]|jgi:putative protease|nr:U32 family peptidase [Clostridiales bacterium]